MRIFLTGANGFFGSRLADQLSRDSGHELVLLVRGGRSANAPSGANVRVVTGDLTEPGSYAAELAGCDAVVHTAAAVSTWARDKSVFERVNVRGTLDLIEKATAGGVGKIIYVSSFLALPPSPAGAVLDESVQLERDTHYNDYELTKYRANLEVSRLIRDGAPVVVLYPTVMYGPGPLTAGNLVVNMVIDHLLGRLPARLGDGTQTWNFAYVDDVVRGAVRALEAGRPGDRFILGGENVTLNEFFEIVHRVTGKAPPRIALPWPVARMAGAAEELLAWLTGRIPRTTRGVIDIFRLNWAYDSAHARDELGYAPLSLQDGMKRTVAWLRSEGLAT
ncbi:MAG: NAD-dependent epimerase/dehydratase family protein [Candidatus Glassbacteria bacterium]|nr:NAD-dependent epimerase/dehydratase family protein [Candidatus Glassbacteria bacterium]